MFKLLAQLGRDTRGATAVEYGLILALLFLGMVGGVSAFGQAAIDMWDGVNSDVTTASNN